VLAAVERDGTRWTGGTTWRGRRYMRITVSNLATTEADVARSWPCSERSIMSDVCVNIASRNARAGGTTDEAAAAAAGGERIGAGMHGGHRL
jgi:hypothetical protein